jgi:hypothetical protein
VPKSIETLVSFSAGEWSPTLTSRVDQQKYRAACIQLRNMLCLKTGPATRRPGTQFIAPAASIPVPGNYAVRLQDFQFSVNTTFILEFGEGYIRFYSNGQQVTLSSAPTWVAAQTYHVSDYVEDPTDSNNIYRCVADVSDSTPPHSSGSWVKQSIYQVSSPYDATIGLAGITATEVFQLQFCQINDVVYIVHPNHPRYKLTRNADTDWTMEVVVDTVPALLDQNATDTVIASSATQGTTNLDANAPSWTAGFLYEPGNSVSAAILSSQLVVGNFYIIAIVGTTDWTLVGAASNTVNLGFVATGTTTGSGEAIALYACLKSHVSTTFTADLSAGNWASQPIFLPAHVGAYWELSYLRDAAYVEYTGVAATGFDAGTSATITAFGDWEVRTYGVWSADIAVQASTDGGVTWQQVRQLTGRNDRNANISGTAVKAQLYRIVVSNVSVPPVPGATNPRIVFECVDAFLFGIVQITSVQDAWHATANVITQLPVANAWVSGKQYFAEDRVGYNGVNYIALNDVTGSTPPPDDPTNWEADGYPTPYWSEGAWSGVRGYPRAITAFQQRVWCGFTAYEPQRVWGTQTGDIENWDLGDQTNATDAVAFDLDAVGDGSGVWLQAQDSLFAGFVSAEWVVSSSDPTAAIGPTSVTAHRQSRWGSNPNIAARVVGDALVFVQRQAFSMRQMLFSIATNKYMSQDLTALSDTILNSGALQLAYQQQGQKNGFLWATTANGELVAMTYELDQEIFGWSRHFTGVEAGDVFESVASIPGKGTDDDEVWVVVHRVVNGSGVRYVERLNPINWYNSPNAVPGSPSYPADKNSAFYVDAGVTYQNPGSATFTGLSHLEGRTVAVFYNGADYGRYVVAGGEVTVDNFESASTPPDAYAHIGLPFQSTLQPMNLDVDVHTGVTKGIIKKVTGLTISFYDTLACKFSNGSFDANGNLVFREIVFRDGSNPFAEVPLFTGDKQIRDFPGGYGLQIPVILYTDGPLPLTVLSVAVDYGLSGQP